MRVTTKAGDVGRSTLPTVRGSKVSKGALAFDVLGMIDRMDHCIQVCCVEMVETDMGFTTLGRSIRDFLSGEVLNGVRGLYGVLLSDHCYSEEDAKKQGWNTIDKVLDSWAESNLETVYRYLTGKELGADLAFRCFSRLGLAFNSARLQARDLERLIVKQMEEEAVLWVNKSHQENLRNHGLVLPFLNRLSDLLYECMLVVEAEESAVRIRPAVSSIG